MQNNVFDEYDYIYVTVKSETVEKVSAGYETLGWECVKEEEHSRYFDELNLTFRRPHVIVHKDERQLMQIYLESAINGYGKLLSNPRPLTTAFLVIFGILLLAAISFGVAVVFLWGGIWFVCGIVVASAAAVLFIPYALIAKKISGYEYRKGERLKKEYLETIAKVCTDGKKFLDGEE